MIFVNPYEEDLALIGTTDIPVEGDPGSVQMDAEREAYLLAVLDRYFSAGPAAADIVHRFSGVRPLFDDDADNPSAVTRDYIFDVDPGTPEADRPPLLSVFGGKITTYRKLAEHALDRLRPFFPAHARRLDRRACRCRAATSRTPTSRAGSADFGPLLSLAARRACSGTMAGSMARAPDRLIGDARRLEELGRHFGGQLYEREARFLIETEWAETAEDILDAADQAPSPPDSGRAGRLRCLAGCQQARAALDRRRGALEAVMTTSLFLGLDVGTSGVRGIAIDETGVARAQASRPMPAPARGRRRHRPGPGHLARGAPGGAGRDGRLGG